MKHFFLKVSILALTLIASSITLALTPTPADPQSKPIAITGATAHLGNGQVIEQALITFDKGVITGVFEGALVKMSLQNFRVIDASGHHVYPGFIQANSSIGLVEIGAVRATVDRSETGAVNPNVRALVAYNTDSELIPVTRRNGVLTLQVTPSGGVLSGSSAVVQVDAWNWEDAAIVADDGVHLNFPRKVNRRFDWTTFSLRYEPNKRYDDQIRDLNTLFQQAAAYRSDTHKPNLKLAALQGLLDGSQRLYIHANTADDIVAAVQFAQDRGVAQMSVLGADGLLPAADFLARHDIPVIIDGVHRLPEQSHSDIDAAYKLPAQLLDKGLTVGITYSGGMQARNLPFLAGTAVAYGVDPEQAVSMITRNNAIALGIDDELGTLAEGKRATLFISRGDALDMQSLDVTHAFVDGREIVLDGRQEALHQRFKAKYSNP